MRPLTPREDFIWSNDIKRVARVAWDAMVLASSHDPDHEDELEDLRRRVEKLEKLLDVKAK